MKLSQTFIPLPVYFDADRLAEEVAALPDSAWIAHPGGLEGNSAVPLVSVGGGENDLFQGAMAITPHLEGSPYHQQVLASFNEILGRSRLMKVGAGYALPEHVDADYHWTTRVRVHVPIITNPGVTLFCAGEELHLKAGDCWIFNTWQPHSVANNGSEDRIHLVFDISGSSRFWRTVREMEIYDQHTDLASLGNKRTFIPYKEGKDVTIATEKFNVSPLLAPGEVDAIVDEILREIENNPNNNPAAVGHYNEFLTDFAKDWRQVWLAFGFGQEGWPQYEKLVRGLLSKVQEVGQEPALLKSNGANAGGLVIKRLIMPSMNFDFLKSLN